MHRTPPTTKICVPYNADSSEVEKLTETKTVEKARQMLKIEALLIKDQGMNLEEQGKK